jgi:hypothetical protein
MGGASAARAQSMLAPVAPSYSTTPPAVLDTEFGESGTVKTWLDNALPSPADLFNWGPVVLHPHVDYSVTYGSGLESQPGDQNTSVIQRFTPGVLFNIGTHWTLDYAPTFVFYSNSQLRDAVNQSVTLNWGTSFDDWRLNLSQSYQSSSDPLVQTGTQTATENYNTILDASYAFNSKMSVDLNFNQSVNSADQFSSSTTWNTLDYLNYQFWPRLTAGVGLGVGYDSVSNGPNMSHETAQVRVDWRVANKLSLNVHGGGEDRQFIHSDEGNLISPTYGAAIVYTPLDFTAINLSLDRNVSPAITTGAQASDATTLSLSLNQRLLKRLQLSVIGTYIRSEYINSVSGPLALNFPLSAAVFNQSRTDTYYSLNTQLSLTLLRRVVLSGTYQYSENMSTVAGFGFSSSQVGIDISYRY